MDAPPAKKPTILITGRSKMAMASIAAQMASAGQSMNGGDAQPLPAGGRVIANKGQAMPKGAQRAIQGTRAERKAQAKAAGHDLMALGRDDGKERIIVAHLQPRWLRKAVETLMDKGAEIDEAWIDRLRAKGPAAALLDAEVY